MNRGSTVSLVVHGSQTLSFTGIVF